MKETGFKVSDGDTGRIERDIDDLFKIPKHPGIAILMASIQVFNSDIANPQVH